MASFLARSALGSKRSRGKVTTTNATQTAVAFPGGAVSLSNSTAWLVQADVVARRTDTGSEVGVYKVTGGIKRGTTAGSTALVGSVTTTTVAEDTAAWDVTLTADTTAGAVKVMVTGEASKTINWVCQLRLVQA